MQVKTSRTRLLNAIHLTNCARCVAGTLCLFIVVGCASGGGGGNDSASSEDDSDQSGNPSLSNFASQTFRVVTDAEGNGSVAFETAPGANKLAVNVEAPGSDVQISSLTSSQGQEYVSPGGVQISLSSEFFPGINTAIAPSRGFDPSIEGVSSFQLQATTHPGSVPLDVTVQSRFDSNLSSGSLQINIFRVGATGASSEVASAIDQAIEVMQGIYSSQAGINVSVSTFEIPGPENLPNPITGDPFYRSASAAAPAPAVNIFVASDVAVGSDSGTVLGVAGGLPAPTIPSSRSATAVSILAAAGADGTFNAQEIRLMGETFAHEVGHYLGLFHPVELGVFLVSDSDVLPDTPECFTFIDCVANPVLVKNVMFPMPVPQEVADILNEILNLLETGGTVPQDTLTPEQAAVMNRNILVD